MLDRRISRSLTGNVSFIKRRLRDALFIIGFLFLISSVAGPYWGSSLVKRPGQSRDIMVVLDTSRSMLATDISPSRLKHAKWFIQSLLEQTPGDRFGLIAFAGHAFLECPLTQDRNGILLFLNDINTDTISVGGTNIEEALRTALDAFKAAEGQHRAIVLITDGDELQGDSSNVLQDLSKRKIPIYVVGIGDPTLGSVIQIEGNKFIADKNGNRVKSKLNEASLQRIAQSVDGTYVHSTVVHDGLQHIVDKVQKLVPEQQENNTISRPVERYQFPLLIGFICLLARMFIGERISEPNKFIGSNRFPIFWKSTQVLLIVTGMNSILSIRLQGQESDSNESNLIRQEEQPAFGGGSTNSQSNLASPPGISPISDPLFNPDSSGQRAESEKMRLINKSIESIKEKLTQAKDPLEIAYLRYNLAVNYQLKEQNEQAEAEYNSALDSAMDVPELRGTIYQNLGVLKHGQARQDIAVDPDRALDSLAEAQEYYREALRVSPERQALGRNQELVLKDKKLIAEIKKVQKQLADLQQDAQESTEKASEAQQSANSEQDSKNKKKKQEEAKEKTEAAENATNKLKEAAQSLKQNQAAELIEDAAKNLEKAIEEQSKILSQDSSQNTEKEEGGQVAQELINKALQQLGIQKEKEDGDSQETNNEIAQEEETQKTDSDPTNELEEKGTENDKNLSMTDKDSESSSGEQKKLENFDQLQALRILDEIQQEEKDWKAEIKATQKQNRKLKETEKNW